MFIVKSTRFIFLKIPTTFMSMVEKVPPCRAITLKRLQYQLQELKMVDNLLSDWNLDSSNFVNTVKSRILMSNIYNITKQNLSVNRKVKLVKDTCERQEIEDFIKNDSSALNPLIKLLLKCRMYVVLIYLKKIQMVLTTFIRIIERYGKYL